MKKLINKTAKVAGRIYESLIPDEEATQRLTEMYVGNFYKNLDK